MTRILVILGMKGAGKTSLGRGLATRLGLPFADLDELVAKRAGFPAAREAFLGLGKGGFRALEAELLGELFASGLEAFSSPEEARAANNLGSTPFVLATGGGLSEATGALELLAAARKEGRALLLYLEAPPALLYARLEAALSLPAWLGSAPSLDAFAAVQESRALAYRGLEPLLLDAALPPRELLEEALARLYADPFFAILIRGAGRGARSGIPDKENA